MRCKLCGRHLYETIGFATLFRCRFHLHPECADKRLGSDTATVFPLFEKLAKYDCLFAEGSKDGDPVFLHAFHMGERYLEWVDEQDRSIVLFSEDINDMADLRLIAPLAMEQVILFSLWRMEILSDES